MGGWEASQTLHPFALGGWVTSSPRRGCSLGRGGWVGGWEGGWLIEKDVSCSFIHTSTFMFIYLSTHPPTHPPIPVPKGGQEREEERGWVGGWVVEVQLDQGLDESEGFFLLCLEWVGGWVGAWVGGWMVCGWVGERDGPLVRRCV